jgi:integrase
MAVMLDDTEPHTAAAVMAARDGFLISTLWHTALRGDNAGRLRTSDVIFTDGSSVSDVMASGADVQPGSQLFFRPDGTKTAPASNGGRVPVEVLSADDQHLCCIWWLRQLQLEHSAFASRPLSGYLTRPLAPCRSQFADKPMSSSSINAMLKARQQQLGIGGDLTPHGFRRGRLQQLDSLGCSLSANTQHALNKTEAIIQHRYLNRDAHHNNLKRRRK